MFSPRSQAPARPFTSVPSPDEDKRNSEDQVYFPAKQEKTERVAIPVMEAGPRACPARCEGLRTPGEQTSHRIT